MRVAGYFKVFVRFYFDHNAEEISYLKLHVSAIFDQRGILPNKQVIILELVFLNWQQQMYYKTKILYGTYTFLTSNFIVLINYDLQKLEHCFLVI